MLLAPATGDDAYVNVSGGGIVLGNDCIELLFDLTDDHCPATTLTNKLAVWLHYRTEQAKRCV